MTISEPTGKGIFDGALSLGAEAVLFHTRQPSESYNVGAMLERDMSNYWTNRGDEVLSML